MRKHSDELPQAAHRLTGRLEVETEQGTFLGNTRIRLLEAIDTHGSISQAAKYVPLSYKAAWDAVDAMNNLADKSLVTRATGGRHGGGTRLTDYGRQMVELYRALEAEYQAALERLTASMNAGGAGTLQEFRRLLKRTSMKTSARNQFAGTVVGLKAGEVDYEVRLKLGDANELAAVITRDSAENLELTIGMEIWALVKAPSVMILTEKEMRTSARNHLWGEVSRIHRSAINAEVTLALPGGKTVCAVISNESVSNLALAVGSPACAVFKASSVILCAAD
ncbi:MAG: TOBE domain-containing protein [Azoarcus sp.]|jgi:molybdate transport system regulatory protein|nr:TOBE domain-containing protein [Azoarcus sp.]